MKNNQPVYLHSTNINAFTLLHMNVKCDKNHWTSNIYITDSDIYKSPVFVILTQQQNQSYSAKGAHTICNL